MMVPLTRTWVGGQTMDQMVEDILVNPAHIVTCHPATLYLANSCQAAVTRIVTTRSAFTVDESMADVAALIRQWSPATI